MFFGKPIYGTLSFICLPGISCGDVQGIMGIGWPSDSWCNLVNYKLRINETELR